MNVRMACATRAGRVGTECGTVGHGTVSRRRRVRNERGVKDGVVLTSFHAIVYVLFLRMIFLPSSYDVLTIAYISFARAKSSGDRLTEWNL